MYDLRTRYRNSAIVPSILGAIYVVKIATLYYQSANTLSTTSVIINSAYIVTDLALVYVFSILFFSLETIVKIYVIDPNVPESVTIKKELEQSSLMNKLRVLEKWETNLPGNRITQSVVIQSALSAFVFFAVTSSSGLFGAGVSLSILLQMLLAQIAMMKTQGNISAWFWQIKTTVPKDVQLIYMVGMGLLLIVASSAIIRF